MHGWVGWIALECIECGLLGYTGCMYPGIREPWGGGWGHHFGTYDVQTGADEDLLELAIHRVQYRLSSGGGGNRLGEGGEERLNGEEC
jgi:hypothetical protein